MKFIANYFRRTAIVLRATLAAIILAASLATPAMAQGDGTVAKPFSATPKPVHNTMSAEIPGKGQQHGGVASPLTAWTVSLATSGNNLWPNRYANLTATANQDVGITPYYISIYDQTAASYVAICATGSVCSASVIQSQPTTHVYIAYVASFPPNTGVPSGIQATSGTVGVLWHGVLVSLTSSASTLPLGGSASLMATTSADVGPSPFWIEIFDASTGTRLAVCGSGTTCPATASQTIATTHKFVAFVSDNATNFPPTNTIATSNPVYITWTAGNFRITLSGSAIYGTESLTATSNQNVGPTPYYIEIFNLDTGTLLKVCGSGTTCPVTTTMAAGYNHYAAFIASYSPTLPTLDTQANSNEITSFFQPLP